MTDSCRLCGSDRLSKCLTLENAPRSIQDLLEEDHLYSDSATTLSVYQCDECGLVQLTEELEPDYYDKYVMTVSHSPQMRAFQRSQAFNFVSRFGLAGKRVIEIGCGDGNYLQYLHEASAIVHGIEPSRPLREMAQERGFRVLGGYVGRQQPVPGSRYDAFVARQVLEHVPDPNDFLQGARQLLSPMGVGLIEVPSLEQALDGERFYDFFHDHLSYFSSRTLRCALEHNGFDVLEVSRGMNGEYTVALVSTAPTHECITLQHTVDVITEDLHAFTRAEHHRGRRVAAWGAGGKGITVLAVAKVNGICYVVDSDRHKQGRYTPVSHLPIFAPEKLLSDPVDTVIVTALAYRDEILKELRQTLDFKGTIAILGPQLEVLQGGEK